MYDLLTIGIAIVAALMSAIALWLGMIHQRKLLQRIAELDERLTLQQQSINGMTAGTVGLDRRVHQLEIGERKLVERQDTYENQQYLEQPYSHAIRLVQQGASVRRLVDELELSESEANLIVSLHGLRDSA